MASAADVARVATQQGLPVSADTGLRVLRAAPDPPLTDVRVVGVDEWAKQKGQTTATILVDPKRHRIVDVLPDDTPETMAACLRAHPTLQIVTRGRDEAFARAIAEGAPAAQPVADRFHLLQNLRQVLEHVFTHHGVGPMGPVPRPDDPPTRPAPDRTVRALHRPERWRRVQDLVQADHSLSMGVVSPRYRRCRNVTATSTSRISRWRPGRISRSRLPERSRVWPDGSGGRGPSSDRPRP